MKEVEIDSEIVSFQYQHGGNLVDYQTSKKVEKIDSKHSRSAACFASLIGMFRSNKDHTHVYYEMKEDSHQKVKLTKREKHYWIDLCIKHGTMPDYITEETIDKELMEIDVKNLSPSLLFVYLCCFRYFREDPGFIRAIVYLVNSCKMNYYAAFVLASRICMNYGLHHILTVLRKYSEKPDISKTSIPLHIMIGLRRFVTNPEKYDSRTVYGKKNDSCGFNEFKCAQNIESISSVKHDCSVQDLFNLDIVKAIMAESDDQSKKMLDKFLSYKKEGK